MMEVLIPNCAGMDVHQETIVVCALNTQDDGTTQSEVRTFGTLTKNLFELLEWLESKAITQYRFWNRAHRTLLVPVGGVFGGARHSDCRRKPAPRQQKQRA